MIDSIARPWVFVLLVAVPFVFYRAARSYADRSRGAKLWIAGLRSAICVLLIVELAGVTVWWTGRAGAEHICYLADVSESMSKRMREQACEQIVSAVREKGGARSSLVLFGESPAVVAPFGGELAVEDVKKAFEPYLKDKPAGGGVSGRRTDLARAIGLALAGFPAKAQKRIVLLSDGNQSEGDALQQAGAAAEQSVQICPVPLGEPDSRDVVVASVTVPERIKRDEAFDIRCDLRSAAQVQGHLKLYVDDYLADEKAVSLARGQNVEMFRRNIEEGGSHLLRVQFESDVEQPTENDSAYCYVSLPGRPRVLVITESEARPLIEALQAARLRVDRRSPVGAPRTMLGLIRYDAVVVDNVSAAALGESRLRLLRDYVAEFGGGLVLSGGPNSFGAGGYGGTALDEVSPLASDISSQDRPSTSVIVMVDDSRSMFLHGTPDMTYTTEVFGRPPKTFNGLVTQDKANFVKEVFKSVVLSLSTRDRVGAIGMSSELVPARWYVRPQRVTDKLRLIQEFNRAFDRAAYSLLYPTLDEARFNLTNDPASYKEALLVTDGYVRPDPDYERFAMMLLSDGISLSTIGVGADSNVELLDRMARWGGGKFYLATDLKKFGESYQKELEAPAARLLIERPTSVALVEKSPLVTGLDMNLAPTLFGYVRTRPRASARTVLVAEGTNDPILASWRCGAGKVVAFSSAAVGGWATLWVKDWEQGYGRFWTQLVNGAIKEPGKEVYRVQLLPEGLTLKVAADVLTESDSFVNGATVAARLYYLGERGDTFNREVFWEAPLAQTSPGRYEHEFQAEHVGVYLASVTGTGPTAGTVETAGAIVPTPKERLDPLPNHALLSALAQATKGKVAATALEALSIAPLEERRRHDLGFYAVISAGLLLVTEVLVRRWPAFVELRRRRREGVRG